MACISPRSRRGASREYVVGIMDFRMATNEDREDDPGPRDGPQPEDQEDDFQTGREERFDVVDALARAHPTLRLKVRPNVKREVIITALTDEAATLLSNTKTIHNKAVRIEALDPEERQKRWVVMKFPLGLEPHLLTQHPQVLEAERFTLKDRHLERTVETRQPVSPPPATLSHKELHTTEAATQRSWSVHSTLTSDHFAVNITLEDSAPEYLTLPPPKRNIKHINWPTFQQELDTWSETYITPDDINEAEKNLVQAFHAALDKACPVSSHSNRHYKDNWFYDDEVKELYARVNSARKRFRRQRTEDNKELLQAAVRSSDRRLKEIRREKWLEWCSQLNAHTSLARLWDHIRRVTGKTRTRAPLHPTPQVEAERLATLFRDRASSAQLPTNTRRRQDDRLLARRNTIATACQQPSPSDLISQGNAKHRKAQVALLKIEQMCTELGLKINPLKTKAMLIKERRIPEGNLRIQDTDIEWVQKHQCLGIHFDYRLSFKPQVEYLKERMDTRINAMKGMTALSSGADYDVLRSYYVHAVRSLIDYSSIALVGLNPTELHALQVQQNKAMRLIVGAPIWTKLSNLQVETGIAPVEARITKNVAVATAKLLTTPGYPLTRSRLRTAAAQGEQFDTTRWTRKANIALSSSGLRYVGALDEDTACEGYTEPPPWTENHTVYSCKLPEAPRDDTVRRRIHGELQIARLTINDAAVFYTDGSVDEDGRSGAAFIYNGEQFPNKTF
ncbi:hypothetical protein O3P69_011698 [Scylla paramamosain]|uniref:Reverse transcriptase n=1 Tax=Scylla paramamosain TaxID=85552 RepID=A0AAW0SFI7_SCYPA